jgi:hypothetical protein
LCHGQKEPSYELWGKGHSFISSQFWRLEEVSSKINIYIFAIDVLQDVSLYILGCWWGGFGPLLYTLPSFWGTKGIPAKFSKKRVPAKSSKGVPTKSYIQNTQLWDFGKIVIPTPKYRPNSASNLPIPARGGVKKRYTTLILSFLCRGVWRNLTSDPN